MSTMVDKNVFGRRLKKFRVDNGLTISQLSELTEFDPSLISRLESGKRIATDEQVRILSEVFKAEYKELHALLLSDSIYNIVSEYSYAPEILSLVEERVDYLIQYRSQYNVELPQELKEKMTILDNLHARWQSCRPLDSLQLQKMQEFMKVKYSYESNRIEGNTLTLQETHLVIQEGITVSGKSLNEHLEAINHADAIDFLEQLLTGKEHLSNRSLLEIHQLILRGVDTRNAGIYRSVPVYISGSEHKPPEPYMIDKLMEDYFLFYEKNKEILHPVILAAEMKERLVTIHPFIDGNGRVSRLVMNFILYQHGFPTLILKGDNDSRVKYFDALGQVQTGEDPLPFYELIIDHVIESLEEHIKMAG